MSSSSSGAMAKMAASEVRVSWALSDSAMANVSAAARLHAVGSHPRPSCTSATMPGPVDPCAPPPRSLSPDERDATALHDAG